MTFEDMTGRVLKDNEIISYHKNEYSELCYTIYDKDTNEIVEEGSF